MKFAIKLMIIIVYCLSSLIIKLNSIEVMKGKETKINVVHFCFYNPIKLIFCNNFEYVYFSHDLYVLKIIS